VKRRALSVFLFFLGVALAAQSSESQPVNPVQLMAWLAAGVPNQRLVRIAQERGIANACGKEQMRQFEAAGADSTLIRTLTALKPSSRSAITIPAPLLQAAANVKEEHFHEAELELRSALNGDPNNAALHFALGSMLIRQEEWDDAFDEITASAQLMRDFPENHSNLAYIFYRLDDGPNAIAEARTALSMDPQNAEAYQFLGLALYSNGQYAAAVHAFDESLLRDAVNADSFYDMGLAQQAAGHLDGAVVAYRQAIRLKPTFWEAHSNLGLIWHEQNRFEDAIAEYRVAKQLAPEEASVRNNLGNTFCDKGDFDAAISELAELYREHPEWQQGHGCLARAYLSKKQYAKAIAELQLSILQNPTSSSEHRMLGQALILNDRLEEGVHELRLAVTLNPDSEDAHRFLETALFQEQQLTAAEKEFREALRLNASPENHYSLAACLMTMDRYEEALSELDSAARLAPDRTLYRARREELIKLMKETTSR
jgi:superkiller protein 3